MKEFKKINLLGIEITNASRTEVLEYIYTSLEKKDRKYYIVTPNTEIFMLARKNPYYKNVLNEAKLSLPDTIGVLIAAKVMGVEITRENSGVDFMEVLCRRQPNGL